MTAETRPAAPPRADGTAVDLEWPLWTFDDLPAGVPDDDLPAGVPDDDLPVTAPPDDTALHDTALDDEPVTAAPLLGHVSPAIPWWYEVSQPAPTQPPPDQPPPPPSRPRRRLIAGLAALGLVLLVALVAGAVAVRHTVLDGPVAAVWRPAPHPVGAAAAGSSHVVTGPLGTVRASAFQLLSGVTTVSLRVAALGGDLYRVTTPDSSPSVPRVVAGDGQVQLYLAKVRDGDGPNAVQITLNAQVRWQLDLVEGATSSTVDLRGADLAGLDVAGGVKRIELWLPPPHGRVVARMAGGESEVAVHAPQAAAVGVRIGSGAGSVSVDGVGHSGIAPGTMFAPGAWETAPNRLDVEASAGLSTMVVDRY